jgi:hypothetical protein
MTERQTRETPKFTGIIVHRDPRGRFAVRHPTGWHTFEIVSHEPLAGDVTAEPEPEEATPATGGAPEATRGQAPPAPDAAIGALGRPEGTQLVPPEDVAAREGIGFFPDPADRYTVFTAWAAPLGQRVVAEDLDVLKSGVDEGILSLAECRIEKASETVLGNLIRFERVYTFLAPDAPDRPAGVAGAIWKRKQWLLYVDRWLICLTWQASSLEAYDYWYAMANQSFLTFEIPQALWFFTDRDRLTAP